jgi:hypothetical protein
MAAGVRRRPTRGRGVPHGRTLPLEPSAPAPPSFLFLSLLRSPQQQLRRRARSAALPRHPPIPLALRSAALGTAPCST